MAVQKILPQQIDTTGTSNTQVLTSNGTSTYWGTGVSGYTGSLGGIGYAGSIGIGYAGSSGTPGTAATAVRQSYTADGATSVFTVSGGYSPNQISVFLNGVMLRNGSEVTVTNGSTFTIAFTPPNGTLIDVIGSLTVVPTGITAGKAITLALIFGG
jgi:hypothetical protein